MPATPLFLHRPSWCCVLTILRLIYQLNIDLFKKTLGPVEKALKDAGLDMSKVDEVILVGGSTRIPKVK